MGIAIGYTKMIQKLFLSYSYISMQDKIEIAHTITRSLGLRCNWVFTGLRFDRLDVILTRIG